MMIAKSRLLVGILMQYPMAICMNIMIEFDQKLQKSIYFSF